MPSAGADAEAPRWEPAAVDALLPDGSVTGVVGSGDTGPVVAVGATSGEGGERPAAWLMEGDDWQPIRVPGATGRINAAARLGELFVAVGYESDRASAWTSTDGAAWSVHKAQPPSLTSSMTAVVAGGPGLVAIGQDSDAIGNAVWTSPDGGTWTRAPDSEVLTGEFTALAESHGVLLAYPGRDVTGTSALSLAVSSDAKSWRAVDREALGGAYLVGVAPVEGGFVALASNDVDYSVWRSSDGVEWRVLTDAGAQFDGNVNDVASTDAGIVAVGTDESGAVASWLSSDGTRWTRLPELGLGSMFAVYPLTGRHAVSLGFDEDNKLAVWFLVTE